MRFLVDEMFGPDVAHRLTERGHDAVHVADVELAGAQDARVVARAAADGRVVVTEDVGDMASILDARTAAGEVVPPVVIALKADLPRGAGAMAARLVDRVAAWAESNPAPYLHLYWLP